MNYSPEQLAVNRVQHEPPAKLEATPSSESALDATPAEPLIAANLATAIDAELPRRCFRLCKPH